MEDESTIHLALGEHAEHGMNQRRLSRARVARHHQESLACQDSVDQRRETLPVFGRDVEKPRIRRETEGVLRQSKELLVHTLVFRNLSLQQEIELRREK